MTFDNSMDIIENVFSEDTDRFLCFMTACLRGDTVELPALFIDFTNRLEIRLQFQQLLKTTFENRCHVDDLIRSRLSRRNDTDDIVLFALQGRLDYGSVNGLVSRYGLLPQALIVLHHDSDDISMAIPHSAWTTSAAKNAQWDIRLKEKLEAERLDFTEYLIEAY